MIGGPSAIQLHRGGGLDLLAPDPAAITIGDIARGLACARRFAGQTVAPYSVAEHSVHVSRLVPPELALSGLLHDAHEAYTGDLSRPLKEALRSLINGFCPVTEIEHRIDRAIQVRFGVRLCPMYQAVKAADLAMLAAERDQVMGGERGVRWQALPEPATVRVECWEWAEAERRFLDRFGELSEVRR